MLCYTSSHLFFEKMKTVVTLWQQAFNIGTLCDSLLMREDSYVMKTLTFVPLIFVPIATIATIFRL